MSDENIFIEKFDSQSQYWSKDRAFNEIFLVSQHIHATDLLRSRGHLFLNEVHDMLGLPRTSEGQLVGWLHSDEETMPIWWEVKTVREDWVILKFETHGVIYDKIEGPNG